MFCLSYLSSIIYYLLFIYFYVCGFFSMGTSVQIRLTWCKMIRDAWFKNRNVSAANQQRVLIGSRGSNWKTEKELVGSQTRRAKDNQLKTRYHNVKIAKDCSPYFRLNVEKGLTPDELLWRWNQRTSMLKQQWTRKNIQGLSLLSFSSQYFVSLWQVNAVAQSLYAVTLSPTTARKCSGELNFVLANQEGVLCVRPFSHGEVTTDT